MPSQFIPALLFIATTFVPNVLAQADRPAFVASPIAPDPVNVVEPGKVSRPMRPNAPGPNDVLIRAVTQEADGNLRHLRGKAEVETTDMLLKADEIDYNVETGDAEARGNVQFEDFSKGDKMTADRAEYNIEAQTGKFYEVTGSSPAKVQVRPGMLTTSNPFYFEGDWAERIKEKYILHDGFITDCKVPRPWWILRGQTFDIIPGDRALGHKSVFLLKHLPLFYAPVLYKALNKSPRKSGFLTPNVGNSSRRGAMAGLGYFWAINRSYDVLVREQYFSERGLAHHIDFRGKVREGTDFDFVLYGVNDRGLKVGTTTNADGSTSDILQKQGGYLFEVHAKSDLGHGWEGRANINYLSSFLFRQSFTESFHEAIFSESHSNAYVDKHWLDFGLTFLFQRNEVFQSVAPDDKIIIRKLPEVDLFIREHKLSDKILPIYFSMDSTASLMQRTQQLFQTRQFVPRIDLNPHLTTAIHFLGISIAPTVGIRETYYGSSYDNLGLIKGGDQIRSTRELSVDVIFPSLAKIFDAPKWMRAEKVKHLIEERATYRYVTGIDDFQRLIRFDQTELVSNTNEIQFSVINRLYTKSKDGIVNEVLTWTVSQSRFFDPTFGGVLVAGQRNVLLSSTDLTGYTFLNGPRNYSPVVSALRLNYSYNLGVEWRTDYDPLLGRIVNSGVTIDTHVSNYFFSLGHNQVRGDPNLSPPYNQLRASIGIGNDNRKGWNAGVNAYYDYKKQQLQAATAQLTYNTDCCGISVQFRRFGFTRNENQFRVAFAISNIGTFGTLKRQEKIF